MVPLVVRSHYSLMWGTASPREICRTARRLGYDRLALTDTDNLYGLWPFLQSCRAEGITPVVGAEITEPGEYFGEMAAISGEPRSASVISKGRCTVKRYPGDKLEEVIAKYPDISSQLFKTMTSRLQKSNQITVKLAGGSRKSGPPSSR